MSIIDQIKSVQSALGITSNGIAGPQTWGAIYKRITRAPDQPSMIGEIKGVHARPQQTSAECAAGDCANVDVSR
jgi:hypothetical protein